MLNIVVLEPDFLIQSIIESSHPSKSPGRGLVISRGDDSLIDSECSYLFQSLVLGFLETPETELIHYTIA
jgi:hypothetical protein